jgi:competence protein ComGC
MNRACADAERGVTLLEVIIMLTATTALVAALMPSMTETIRHAEIAAATTAMTDIQMQLLTALNDMNFKAFTIDGNKNGTQVNLLVSDGDIPREVSVTGSATWQGAVNNATGLVDFLERHLVTNNPRGNAANAYPTGGGNPWIGAYLDSPIDPDPWGNRYAVNGEFLGVNGAGSNDCVVYSAGPDEEIDTQYAANPVVAGDDDLIVLVES